MNEIDLKQLYEKLEAVEKERKDIVSKISDQTIKNNIKYLKEAISSSELKGILCSKDGSSFSNANHIRLHLKDDLYFSEQEFISFLKEIFKKNKDG